jgi:hypothetical protein
VATFGLKKTAQEGQNVFGHDAKEFVDKNFCMDDGLMSTPDSDQAIDLLGRTQAMLATANLRLHKIMSNNPKVSEAFPCEDRAASLQDLDMSKDTIPVQGSLGVCWDLNSDCFTFRVNLEPKPFIKRGMLSVTNSLYDPLGIAAPVTILGKFLLRAMSNHLKERPMGPTISGGGETSMERLVWIPGYSATTSGAPSILHEASRESSMRGAPCFL